MISTALLEITLIECIQWVDCDYNAWVDCDYNEWLETSAVIKVSQMGYAGDDGYWVEKIIDISPLQFRLNNLYGGHVKASFGDVSLALDTFDDIGIWPPPESADVSVVFVDSSGSRHNLFSGSMMIQRLSRDGIEYQFYGETYNGEMLLDEGSGYSDQEDETNEVAFPRAFGEVKYMKAVRLPDIEDTGNQAYCNGYLAGDAGVDWFVYDDGVDITSHVENEGDGTFEINHLTLPIGEVTVSGTGELETIADVFEWAGLKLGVTVDTSGVSAFDLSYWAESQQVLIDFLDQIAAYCAKIFYIQDGTLYLMDMESTNGDDIDMDENEFFPASIAYQTPVSIIKSEWITRAPVEENIGVYVKDTKNEVSIPGYCDDGSEMTIEPYQTKKADVKAALAKILSYATSKRWEASIPLETTFPAPGQRITAIDMSMGKQIAIDMQVRDLEYDFSGGKIMISGDGVIS